MSRPVVKVSRLACLLLLLLGSSGYNIASEDERLQQELQAFARGYRELALPARSLSYAANLRNVQRLEQLEAQRQFLDKAVVQAKRINPDLLSEQNRLYFLQWLYELDLNQERLALAQRFKAANPNITEEGLLHQYLGKEWYRYFLKEFLSLNITPEELKNFGMQEVQKVQQQIRQVQQEVGFARDSAGFYRLLQDRRFYLTQEQEVIQLYQDKYKTVSQNLTKLFLNAEATPLAFAKVAPADENTPPGIYSSESRTFYFNFFEHRHNLRSMDFLLLHEGIPGHHYQSGFHGRTREQNPLNSLFWYFGYSEGWAAYCEELGKELGLYQTPHDYLGKLEWDLVRSARVVLDVGLNYEGWSKEQALAFWKKHIPNQDAIAMREINRMLRWPVQVHTYKVGADTILKLRLQRQRQHGKGFDIRQFHQQLLQHGPLPLAILKE